MAAMAEAAFVRFAYPLPKAGCEPKEQKAALKASLQRRTMFPKLGNKSISREDAINSTARQTARKEAGIALQGWYDKAFHLVHHDLIPEQQVKENLKIVGRIEKLRYRGI